MSGGTLSGFTGSGTSYSANFTLTTTSATAGSISVNDGTFTDAMGNSNSSGSGSTTASITVDNSAVETQKIIAGFQQSRANQLLAHQPELTHFLSGNGRGSIYAQVTRGNGFFNFSSSPDRPLWFQLNGSLTQDGTSESQYAFAAIGRHRDVRENLLVGVTLEFDQLLKSDGVSESRGTGWMAGPYFVARLPTQPLFFEGRLRYGQTSNEISPFGTYTDSFVSERLLASVKIAGALNYGQVLISPSLSAAYTSDMQKSYLDGASVTIPDQRVDLGQIAAGVGFEVPVDVSKGEMSVTGGLSGIGSYTRGSGTAATIVPNYVGGRGVANLGLSYVSDNGGLSSLAITYDGAGIDAYESYSVDLGYKLSF